METDNIDVVRRLSDIERRVSRLENLHVNGGSSKKTGSKSISLKEYLLSKNPKSDLDKALVIASFFEKISHVESFHGRDLLSGFATAKESAPANINDIINKNIARGMMMQVSEKKDGLKAFTLTGTGERFIENDLKA